MEVKGCYHESYLGDVVRLMVLGRNDMMGEEYLPSFTFARNVTFYRSTPVLSVIT